MTVYRDLCAVRPNLWTNGMKLRYLYAHEQY